MTESGEVLCRYFMQGVCRNGAACRFSHDLKTAPSMVCKFFLAGNCSYGDACRYDHVRPSYAPKSMPARALEPQMTVAKPAEDSPESVEQLERLMAAAMLKSRETPGNGASWAAHDQPGASWGVSLPDNLDDLGISSEDGPAAVLMWESNGVHDEDDGTDLAEVPICSHYAAFGWCGKGDSCQKIHGNLCTICSKHILHPWRPEEAQEHMTQCAVRKQRADAHLRSAEIECGICLEKVLGKSSVSERKFGLMACDHAFCLGCIRGWRTQYSGVDVETALRTCPICRSTTHFITPSPVWPASPEEKDAIVNGYKDKLGSIDCRHFDRGNGTCPFGTSCFYRHMLPDGSLDEPALRHSSNADGEVSVLKPVLLSHFMDLPGTRSASALGRR